MTSPRQPHDQFKREMLESAYGTPFEEMLADNPDAVDSVARTFDAIAHPLTHFICATCGVRFGLEKDTWRFLEQTGASLYCPVGHEGLLAYPDGPCSTT